MCLICVDFQRDKLTIPEARRALGEMVEVLDDEHVREVRQMLADAESESDDD